MCSVKTFNLELQKGIRAEDKLWSYVVRNLPRPEQSDSLGLVKAVTVGSQTIKLRYEGVPWSRVTSADPLHRFLMISFSRFELRTSATRSGDRERPASKEATVEYKARLLKAGMVINGTCYNFFGHSESQLKAGSCFMFAAPKPVISAKIEAMGDFSALKSAGKKAKRIGLLFSTAKTVLSLDPSRVEDIDDIERGGYNFTDGCGFVSDKLAHVLTQHHNIAHRNSRYVPSVYQIRYRGYKGVLMRNPSLNGKILAQFRSSMRKFNDGQDYSLGIVEYSKPYTLGYLNDQIVLLLHALGITSETLLRKQLEHLRFVQAVSEGHIQSTFQFLSFVGRFDLGERLLLAGVEPVSKEVESLIQWEYERMSGKRNNKRCRIMIPMSRLLYGVCDPRNTLKPGTCFVRITEPETGQPRTLINTQVLVTRNPCLHPGDLQKFRVVDVPYFSHLVDCIVFPTTGPRPSADLMSGGDLDGDKFIVIWDPDVVPKTLSQPAVYPGIKEHVHLSEVNDDDRINYFAGYTAAALAEVSRLHLRWAQLKGPMSPECQQLNRLHSYTVDGNSVIVPSTLKSPPELKPDTPAFILDTLHDAAARIIGQKAYKVAHIDSYTPDALDLLLSKDVLAVSEFDLAQLTIRWCKQYQRDFSDYIHFFNFGSMDDAQQRWLLAELPAVRWAPNTVTNGLLHSNIVRPDELERFGLDHHSLHWKSVFDSSTDRMQRFLGSASRTLSLFHKKLILFRPDERLLIAIYIPDKIPEASDALVGPSIRVFALPQSQGPESPQYRVKPTTVNYRLYHDETTFQLFDRVRGNTFIFMKEGQTTKPSTARGKNVGKRRVERQTMVDERLTFDCRASIALDKISADIQRHVGKINREGVLAAEIYVISNRDLGSMKVLDEWLNYVDTEEVLPLFSTARKEYPMARLCDLNPGDITVSQAVLDIARSGDVSSISALSSLEQIQELLELLGSYNENARLRLTYAKLLDLEVEGVFITAQEVQSGCSKLAVMLMQFLQKAPDLIVMFLQSQTWSCRTSNLEDQFAALGINLLRRLILSSGPLNTAMLQPLSLVLQNCRGLGFDEFMELAEIISMTVSDVDLAADILLNRFRPHAASLLPCSAVEAERIVSLSTSIALDHVESFQRGATTDAASIELSVCESDESGHQMAAFNLRIDAQTPLRRGDHVRMQPSHPPRNARQQEAVVVDALVTHTNAGTVKIRCLQGLPSYAKACHWQIIGCRSFVRSKAMLDAVTRLFEKKEKCCKLYAMLVGIDDPTDVALSDCGDSQVIATMNRSQNGAIRAAVNHDCTLVWSPVGTGKSRTIVAVLCQLLADLGQPRILVAAPTHKAVDGLLRAYVSRQAVATSATSPLRVSTQLEKVAADLLVYVYCDTISMESADAPRNETRAEERLCKARLVFTTCVCAGLGALAHERFDIVLIDGSSQQTEPESLIPLVNGCQRVILVGDHAQTPATTSKHAVLRSDPSLFERIYLACHNPTVAKTMLDIQYNIHPDICRFISQEFYQGRLHSARSDIGLPPSEFPWLGKRMVFIQSHAPEDLGYESKNNQGQTDLCFRAYTHLRSELSIHDPNNTKCMHRPAKILTVTPFGRQKHGLQKALPMADVCTIDEFRGHSADIVIFVTTRCNAHLDARGLHDGRILNAVMSGARAGIIVIGDRRTLTDSSKDSHSVESKAMWKRLLESCGEVHL